MVCRQIQSEINPYFIGILIKTVDNSGDVCIKDMKIIVPLAMILS